MQYMMMKAGFHITANCLRLFLGSSVDMQNNMQTYLAGVATTVPGLPQELGLGEIQPFWFFQRCRQDNLVNGNIQPRMMPT